jgi:hypothetical protein
VEFTYERTGRALTKAHQPNGNCETVALSVTVITHYYCSAAQTGRNLGSEIGDSEAHRGGDRLGIPTLSGFDDHCVTRSPYERALSPENLPSRLQCNQPV